MARLIIVAALFVCFVVSGVENSPLPAWEPCTTEEQCPQHTYCYLGSKASQKFCSPCLGCAKYNRHPKPRTVCVRNQDDCGDCLSEYSVLAEHCVPFNFFTGQPLKGVSMTIVIASVTASLWIVFGIAFLIRQSLKWHIKHADVSGGHYSRQPSQNREEETDYAPTASNAIQLNFLVTMTPNSTEPELESYRLTNRTGTNSPVSRTNIDQNRSILRRLLDTVRSWFGIGKSTRIYDIIH